MQTSGSHAHSDRRGAPGAWGGRGVAVDGPSGKCPRRLDISTRPAACAVHLTPPSGLLPILFWCSHLCCVWLLLTDERAHPILTTRAASPRIAGRGDTAPPHRSKRVHGGGGGGDSRQSCDKHSRGRGGHHIDASLFSLHSPTWSGVGQALFSALVRSVSAWGQRKVFERGIVRFVTAWYPPAGRTWQILILLFTA